MAEASLSPIGTRPIEGTPKALVSYSHADETVSVGRLAEELRLRGFGVVRDTDSFRGGRRIGGEMAGAVDADLVVAHLTENALSSEAVLNGELRPALRSYREEGHPVVLLIPRDLGSTRKAIDEAIKGRLPVSVETTWGDIAPQGALELPIEFCAEQARKALHSVFGPGLGPDDGRWNLQMLTRGTRRSFPGLNVDATDLAGGRDARPGDPGAWDRILTGVCDLEETLREHGSRRDVDIVPFCHLGAALALGFAFRRSKGWRLCVKANNGAVCTPADAHDTSELKVSPVDQGTPDGRLFVEIDLVGRTPQRTVDRVVERSGSAPAGRITIARDDYGHIIRSERIGGTALAVAAAVKSARGLVRASEVHIFMAVPASFAVLLGSELNALGATVCVHEHDGDADDYVNTIQINAR